MRDFAVITSIVLVFSLCLFIAINNIEKNVYSAVSELSNKDYIVILDAGHGGEDGGAVAYDGTCEKDINLEFTKNISLYFDLLGIEYIEIRTSDISVGDTSLETIRSRKNSDIFKRYDIINSFENSILLSIHQNMFSVEKYCGTQVFYADSVTDSKIIADCIQKSVSLNLQPDNNRKIKSSSEDIYLLFKAKRPSVMVECGFMSNFNELSLLKTYEYRSQMSYFIVKGILGYFNQKKVV